MPKEKCPVGLSDDGNGRRRADRPAFPHITCIDGVYVPVIWGWVGKAFLISIAISIGASGTTAWRLNAGEEADATLESNVKTIDRNVRKLDEQQRIQASQTALTVKQLNKLLELEGVTKRIEAPPVEKSELEDLE
jgi:hypothetical protein